MFELSRILPFFQADGTGGSGGSGDGGSGDGGELSKDLADLEDDDSGGEEEEGEGEDHEEDDGEEGEEGEGETSEDDEKDDEDEGEEGEEEEEGERGKKKAKTRSDERTPLREIREKYSQFADILKEYPWIKSAIFGHQRYIEIFPDVESAQEASQKSSEYDQFEASLARDGSFKLLFDTLQENNPRALKKLISNFPDQVRELDQDTYVKAIATPVIEELLYHAAKHGEKVGGKAGQNLKLAAQHLANYVFVNGGEIPDISKRKSATTETDAEKELREERETRLSQDRNRAVNEVEVTAQKELNSFINAKLDGLTDFERKAVISDTRREVDAALSNDKTFQSNMGALWRRAQSDGYSDISKARIKNAWLARAKSVAPGIRNRLRQEALDAREGKSNSDKKSKKRQFPATGGSGDRGKRTTGLSDPKKINWRKTSDADIINS